jgi:hypothetical protein
MQANTNKLGRGAGVHVRGFMIFMSGSIRVPAVRASAAVT